MPVELKQRPRYVVNTYGIFGKHSHLQWLRTWGWFRDTEEKDKAVEEALAWAEEAVKTPRYREICVNVKESRETSYFIT